MKWIKRIFGLSTPVENKQEQLSRLLRDAMIAQRNGDLRKYAELTKMADTIEDDILEMLK